MKGVKPAIRLSNVNLSQLGTEIKTPAYDRNLLLQNTFHKGVGYFIAPIKLSILTTCCTSKAPSGGASAAWACSRAMTA
jgi:hypothetical protein